MTSYDIIGSIAILKPRKGNGKLAKELLKRPNIRSIYEKVDRVKGRLRKAKFKWLAGKKKTETFYKENNCIFFFDINKTYFSSRLSNERLEIAKKVKKGEKILIMFSGISPYSIVISRNSSASRIIDTELSREAVKYAKKNLELNKIKNIKVIQGDVKKLLKGSSSQIKKNLGFSSFDRIIMARPQLPYDFLKEAFKVCKKGTIIHFYDFVKVDNIDKSKELVKKGASQCRRKIRILQIKKAGDIAPYKYRIRIDFKVLK